MCSPQQPPIPACPECGAPSRDGLTCRERFHSLLALEWQDSALFARHFFTVAAFNIQHPAQFTDEAIEGLRASFVEMLDNRISTTELRKRTGREFDGQKRVLKPPEERIPLPRKWSMTITEVYVPDDPQGAAERVREWAESIRDDLNLPTSTT